MAAERAARSATRAEGYRALTVSTRGLIITALVCGLAILVAFAVQVLIAR